MRRRGGAPACWRAQRQGATSGREHDPPERLPRAEPRVRRLGLGERDALAGLRPDAPSEHVPNELLEKGGGPPGALEVPSTTPAPRARASWTA